MIFHLASGSIWAWACVLNFVISQTIYKQNNKIPFPNTLLYLYCILLWILNYGPSLASIVIKNSLSFFRLNHFHLPKSRSLRRRRNSSQNCRNVCQAPAHRHTQWSKKTWPPGFIHSIQIFAKTSERTSGPIWK